MQVFQYIYKRTISSILIVTIMMSQVIIWDPIVVAFEATRDTMNLVAILVSEELLKDTLEQDGLSKEERIGNMNTDMSRILSDGSLSSDLGALGVNIGNTTPKTVAGRVVRYADDIQKQLQNTKIMIIPVPSMDTPEKPWRIQEVLDRLYTEGDISDGKIAKLQGVVMIGDVPLPLVTKGSRTFLSVYPYTDFEDPAYTYDHSKGQFLFNEHSGTLKAEVWHGVIRYPVSWQQYLLDTIHAAVLADAKMKDSTGEEYKKALEKMKTEFMDAQRKELAAYFDKNHSYYIGGEYSEFSKKAIQMDLFRELGQVTQLSLQGYQEFVENWDNVSYLRYTKKWLNELTDKFYPKTKNQLQDTGKVPTANNNIGENDPTKKDVFATVKDLAGKFEDTGNSTEKLIPDIFTKEPIDKFLSRSSDVFGFLTNSYAAYLSGTGRWDFAGKLKEADGTSIFKIIDQIDVKAQSTIRSVNDSMEKVLDEMLDTYKNDKNLMLDVPSGEVDYFGKFLKTVRLTPPQPYVDVDPSPEWSNNYSGNLGIDKIHFVQTQIDTNAKDTKDPMRKKYIPFTGQDFDEVMVHVESDPNAAYKLKGYSGFIPLPGTGGGVKGGTPGEPQVYYNPNATQEKYIEYVDDIKNPDPFFGLKAIWETVSAGKVSGDTIKGATYTPYRKAILHLVNKPFSAEDCTIFVGGAPKDGVFVRGGDVLPDTSVEGWNDSIYEGTPGGSDWREEKVKAQVDYEIAPKQAVIDTMRANPPKDSGGDPPPCPTSSQIHAWDIRAKELERDTAEIGAETRWTKFYNVSVDSTIRAGEVAGKKYDIARGRAQLMYERATACSRDTSAANRVYQDALKSADDKRKSDVIAEKMSWEQYMSSGERGDAARLKDFLDYAKRLPQTIAQTVEANKLYNIAADAYMDSTKQDKSEQKKRPESEYYDVLNADGTGLAGGTWGGYKAGYYGDCTATNLKFTDDGEAIPPDTSIAKGRLTMVIDVARGQKTSVTNRIGGFIKGIFSFGQADKLEKAGLQQGILLRMKVAPQNARWESGSEIDRVVAILRKIENPEEKVKAFEEPFDLYIAAAVLDSIQDPTYNPDPKSSDPLDKLVAVYRTLPNTAEQSKYNMLLSIIQLAISQSKYDPTDPKNTKQICQPMKALSPIKDVAGSKSIESSAYQGLTATRVIERENRTTTLPKSFIIGPGNQGVMVPQLQITAEEPAGYTSSKMSTADYAAAMIKIAIQQSTIKTTFLSQYQQLLAKNVKAFFPSSTFNAAPQIGIKNQSQNGENVEPYRDQIQAQNRYALPAPKVEKIKPETSYKACLLYADYGMPLSVAQKNIRQSLAADINKLQEKSTAYVYGNYGAKEQLPPALKPDERKWEFVTLGDSPEVITNYVGTMKQVPNGEEKLGLDKKDPIVSIIKHKEPTNETIAKQLKNSTSFDLPVDSPRYVDMFHYDPIAHWGSVPITTKTPDGDKTTYKSVIRNWSEYYEHVRFPYLDWFNVYDKDKKFAYVTEDSRSSLDKTLLDIGTETRKIARHFQQYINDYIAQTSLQGGAAQNRDTLKGMSFDYDKALKESAIVKDVTDDKKKIGVAEERLSFAVYWQHLSMSEKYKYVLHNYLSGDTSLSQGNTPKVDPTYFGGKTGFEAGTIIAESSYPDAIPLGLENLTYTQKQKAQVVPPTPITQEVVDKVKTCKKGNYYDPTGVPLLEWPSVIVDCWFPTLTPPITFPNTNEKYETFAKRVSEAGQDVTTKVLNTGEAFAKFSTSVKDLALTAGKVAEAMGNKFQDIDGDGLPMVGTPSDPNVFLSDSKKSIAGTAQLVDGSNGFKDVQDYVRKVSLVVGGNTGVTRALLSTKSITPLTVQTELRSSDGQLLEGNSFDYVQVEMDDKAKSIVTMSSSERIQKSDKGKVTFNLYPTSGSAGMEGRLRFHVVRQKVSNSDQPFEVLNPDIASDWITVKATDQSLAVSYLYTPTKDNGRNSFSEGAIFTTDDKVHTLSMAAVDTNGNILDNKTGSISIEYKKENTTTGGYENYKDTKIPSRIAQGKNAVGLPIPREAGKYLVAITPEASLDLPQVKTTFIVVESKISSVGVSLAPSVLVEGGTTHVGLSFLDAQKKEVLISDQLAQFVVPTTPQIPLDIQSLAQLDGYPENKTATENPIDFMIGKVNQLTVNVGAFPEGGGEYVDIPMRLQISDTIKKSTNLRVYKKGALSTKVVIQNEKPSYSVMDSAPITADVSVRDKAGAIVPYTGTLNVGYGDQGYFENAPMEVNMKDGKGTLVLTQAHKSGTTHITISEPQGSITPQEITLKFTAGSLAKVHFTSTIDRPLEPQTDDSKLGKNMTEMMLEYQGEDSYGNVIETNDPVLFDVSPFEGVNLYEVKSDATDGAMLPITTVNDKKYYSQTLTSGKARLKIKSTKYTGEVTLTLAGQAKESIVKDSLRIPIRFTLYKEFIQRLKPNILYTNLLGGNYGDVTKKDFMAGWWLLSGKTQAVTASTISAHEDPVSVRVLPNGTIDIPSGDGIGTRKVVVPIYNTGEPFQLEVREQDTNKALMRVRYNIAPLTTVKEIATEAEIKGLPGLYFKKSEKTKITHNADTKQSILVYDGKEIGKLGDNLQFQPTGTPPELDVNTDRRDLLQMSLKTAEGVDVVDIYAVLNQENIYETTQGFSHDAENAKSKKEAVDYEVQASQGKPNIAFSETLQKASAELAAKKILVGVEDKDRFVNKVIVSRSEVDQYKGGTFLEASTQSLYSVVGGDVVMAGVDTILSPKNIPGSVQNANIKLVQTNQPSIKVQAIAGGLQTTYLMNDVHRAGRSRDLLQVRQLFRSTNLPIAPLPKVISPGLFADMQFADTVKTSDKVETTLLGDRIQIKKTYTTVIPGSQNGNVNIPSRTESETVTAAEVYPDGSYLLADARFEMRRTFAANILQYTVVEKSTGKTIAKMFMVIDPAILRILPYTEGTALMYSSQEQGLYVDIKDSNSTFDEVAQEIKKGNEQVLSLVPEHFLEMTTNGYAISIKDPVQTNLNTKNTLVLQLKTATNILIADMYLQLHETPLTFTTSTEEHTPIDALKGEVVTALTMEKKDGEVRIKDTAGNVVWSFIESTFEQKIMPPQGWQIVPEQLDGLYVYTLKNADEVKAKITIKLPSQYVPIVDAEQRTTSRAPAFYVKKVDPYLVWSRTVKGAIEGFTLSEFGKTFVLRSPLEFTSKNLELTTNNNITTSTSYRDEQALLALEVKNKNNPEQKKVLLELQGGYAPQVLPMKLYEGEHTTGIYFASTNVKNASLSNGYTLERRVEGEQRTYWKIKKDAQGTLMEEKEVALVKRDGTVALEDTDFEWKMAYTQGNYTVALYEKATGNLVDSISMLLLPGTITRVLPYKNGDDVLYNPNYQGVYTQLLDDAYYLDQNTLSIRKKNVTLDEVLSFKKGTFFETQSADVTLVPAITELTKTGTVIPPAVSVVDKATGKKVAEVAISFNEVMPGISIKQTPASIEQTAKEVHTAVISTLQPSISVKDTGSVLEIVQTSGTSSTRLMTVEKRDVSKGSSDSALVDVSLSAISPDGYYLTLFPKGGTTAFATISYKNDPRYTPITFIGKSSFGEVIRRPGIYIREVEPMFTVHADPVGFTQKVLYGYDDAFVMSPNGVLQSKNPNIFTIDGLSTGLLPTSALSMTMKFFGKDVAYEFYKLSSLPLSTTTLPSRLLSKGLESILPSSGNIVTLVNHQAWGTTQKGIELNSDASGHLISGTYQNNLVAQWTTNFVPTLLGKTRLSYDPSSTKGIAYQVLQENGEKLLTYVLTPNFVERATISSSGEPTAEATKSSASTLTYQDTQDALNILDAHGVFVEKRVQDSWWSVGYEATGESTNNPYALILKDQTLTTSKTDSAGNTGIGVEDALTDSGSGAGWTGDFKNMVLFAAGNSVGKSTLPHMSEALINLGDPVISLSVKEKDNRTNDMYTNDVGEFIMEHAAAGINTIKVFDIDSDGRKDILFAEKSGKIFGIKNMGGNPIMWKYMGELFDVPDGIKKLLVTKLDGDEKLDLMISTGKDNIIASKNENSTAMNYAEGSMVSLMNLGNGIFQRGVNSIKELGKVEDMQMGDFDGNGTDDLLAINDKKELKVVLIAPTLPDGTKPPFKTITLDTLGMSMTSRDLAPEDVYIRFQNTKLFDHADAPTAMPPSPDVVFVPNVEGQGTTNADTLSAKDPGKAGFADLFSGTETAFRSIDGLRSQMVKMLVSSEQPYVRSGGTETLALDNILFTLKKTNPFSFMSEGIIGVLNPINTIAQARITNEILTTPTRFAVSKKGVDLNGGKIHKGDRIKYEIAASTTLPQIKGFDLGDRVPQNMDLLPGSLVCELQETGKNTWKALSLKDECTLSNVSGGDLFQLYFKNISLKNGEKLRITYQAEVVEEPIDFHLNLLSFKDGMTAVAASMGVDVSSGLNAIAANIAMGDKAKRMGVNVTSDTFGGRGSLYYQYKEGVPLFEKFFIKDKTQKPGAGNPLMDELAKLMGYTYDDEGNLVQTDPSKTPDTNAIKDFAQNLGKTLQTATSTDKDEDGVPDLWDNEVIVRPEYTNARVAGTQADLDTGAGLVNTASDALDQVNKRLSEKNCYYGGCGLFPKNKAFLVPGKSELFEGPDIPVFAFPTPSGVVPVWPPDASYFNSKSVSQIRVYFSVTLSARMAMAVCVGPYDYGNADTSALTGISPVLPNANCYAFILPDVFNLVKLCQSLEGALTGVVTAATDLVGGGAYAAARVKKRGIVGAGSEADGSFTAYHYELKDGTLSPSITEQFITLARNSSVPNTARNKHSGGFPAIPMDWVERQMDELLKLLKLPNVYIRLPDPRSLIGSVVKGATKMAQNVTKKDPTEAEKEALKKKIKNDTRASLEAKAKTLGIANEREVTDAALKSTVLSDMQVQALKELLSMDSATLKNKALELQIKNTNTLTDDQLRTQIKEKNAVQITNLVNAMNRATLLSEAKNRLLVVSDTQTDDQVRTLIATKEQQLMELSRQKCASRIDTQAATKIANNDAAIASIDDSISRELAKLPNAKEYLNTILDSAQGAINCEGDFIGQQMQNILGDGSMYAELSEEIADPQLINSFLMKQKGIGDALEFLSKIPLLRISHEEVVFDYPWIAPEKFFAVKENIQYALDQSIENFQNFYKANADCFFDDPKAFNTISEPNFSIVPRIQANGASRIPTVDTQKNASVGADVNIRCLATARLGSEAWVNIQGLQKNLERLGQYANIQEKFKKYLQWKSYTVGRLVQTTTGVIDFLSGYISRQQKILNNWKRALSQIKNYSKTFQVVVDVFQNYRNSCADCVNDKGSAFASVLDALGNIIPDIPVVRVPRWPDIVVDFSNVRAQMRITIPDIKLRPIDFQIPKLSPITLPKISVDAAISEQEFTAMMKKGIDVRFPVLPALPDLPDLPEFPQLDLPKLADLPPPPVIPKLDVTITTTIQILDKILQNVCLVRKNLIPIPEWQLATQIEKLTRGTTLSKVKVNHPSDIVLPGIDQIKVQGYIKLINKEPYTALTDLVKMGAENWNKNVIEKMQKYISGEFTSASDNFTKIFSDASHVFKDAQGKSALDRFSEGIKNTLQSTTESVNGGLSSAQGKVQQFSDDLVKTLSSSTTISSTDAQAQNTIAVEQNLQLVHALESPDVQNLFVQMDALKNVMANVSEADGISFDTYIPSLRAQIELLKKSGDTLGEAKNKAIEKIEDIIALADKERTAIQTDTAMNTDSYSGIRTWKNMKTTLQEEQTKLQGAEYSIHALSTAKNIDDFRKVLADANMLESSTASHMTASLNGELHTSEEYNLLQQTNLEAIVKNAAVITPIDYEALNAPEITETSEVVSDVTPQMIQSNQLIAAVAPLMSDAGKLIADTTTTSSVSNTTPTPTPTSVTPAPQTAATADTSANLLIQLNDTPGSFVPIMNYSGGNNEDSGIDSMEDLNGDGQRDIVYYQGRDIMIKYNILLQSQGKPSGAIKAIYTGTKRIYLKTIGALLPVTPRVQNLHVISQNARQAIIGFQPQTRGEPDALKPSVYALRFHRSPDAWLTDPLSTKDAQNNYVEYYVYASPESTYGMDVSRIPALMNELHVADQMKKEQLKSDELGTPKERIIVIKKHTDLQAIVSFTKSGVPYSTTMASYDPSTKAYGTFSNPILLHPQKEQDNVPPTISLKNGAYMTVPTNIPVQVKATATDPSEIASMYWDTDTTLDSDLDGNATNDRDTSCSDPKDPASKSCSIIVEKNGTVTMIAPEPRVKPFSDTEIGKKFVMRLHAIDTVGNISTQDLTLEPRATNIVIDSYDSVNGIVDGHIDPPLAGIELRVMKMKNQSGNTSKVISELPLPQNIVTKEGGGFHIEGLLAKESLGILGSTNLPVAEITKTGEIRVNDTYTGKTLDVLIRQGDGYIRKLFSTLSIKAEKILKTEETSLEKSYLKDPTKVSTEGITLQIMNKDKIRLSTVESVQKIEVQQGGVWKSLYEFTANADNTLHMSQGVGWNKNMIGGESIVVGGVYVNMLLINVDGIAAGVLSIPLRAGNELFDVKGAPFF